MVRFGYFSGAAKIGIALALALATGYAFAAVSIANTKHNLSSSSAATIKAAVGGTDSGQICVFCHTPHNANTSQPLPLWNKQLSVATYTTYTSDYLTALGYPGAAAFTPGQSSRVCLSCHDGTVAIGGVYNLDGTASPGIITMSAGVTTMPNTAGTVGYLGTNLVDDHPVGYEYKSGGAYPPVPGQTTDPQLKTYGTAGAVGNAAVAVNLDPKLSTGKVECKSCHDPHKGDFGKFLVETNVNAALCKRCHDKGDINIPANSYDASGHNTSTQTFNKAGGDAPLNRTTVGAWSCLACHTPHTNPGVTTGIPILKRAEETTCYEQGCHGALTNWGAGNATVGSLNIAPEMVKTHAHPTNTFSGKHKDIPSGESTTQLGGIAAVNRHGECFDCHNPHQVQPAVAKNAPAGVDTRSGQTPWTYGTTSAPLRISKALLGTWGVQPTWPAAPTGMATNIVTFTAPATFTKVSGASLTDEYQVCLKCHSNYITLPAGARNLAKEINPDNSSYHGIVPFNPSTATFTAATQKSYATNFYVNTQTMAQPWAGSTIVTSATTPNSESCRLNPTQANCLTFAASRARVWCSDCHNSNATPVYPSAKSTTVPSGPHGSTLNGTGPGTSNTDKMLIDTIVSNAAANNTPLCVRCHLTGSYSAGKVGSRGTRHGADTAAGRAPQGCFSCHMWENPANVVSGTGDIFPHGMNKRWATIGSSLPAVAGSLQAADSFLGGWYTNINYSGTGACWTTQGDTTLPAGSPCNGHTNTGY